MNTVRTELKALFDKLTNQSRMQYRNHDRVAPFLEQPKSDRQLWVRLCLSGPEVTATSALEFFRDEVYALDTGHEGTSLLTIKGWFTETPVFEAFRGQLFRQHLSMRAPSLFDINEWGLVHLYSEALEVAGRLRATEHVWEKEMTQTNAPATESVH